MNCKPGDLAISVGIGRGSYGIGEEAARALLGHIVRVTRLRAPLDKWQCCAELVWEFENPLVLAISGGRTVTCYGAADEILRPIKGAEISVRKGGSMERVQA